MHFFFQSWSASRGLVLLVLILNIGFAILFTNLFLQMEEEEDTWEGWPWASKPSQLIGCRQAWCHGRAMWLDDEILSSSRRRCFWRWSVIDWSRSGGSGLSATSIAALWLDTYNLVLTMGEQQRASFFIYIFVFLVAVQVWRETYVDDFNAIWGCILKTWVFINVCEMVWLQQLVFNFFNHVGFFSYIHTASLQDKYALLC